MLAGTLFPSFMSIIIFPKEQVLYFGGMFITNCNLPQDVWQDYKIPDLNV